MTSVEKMFDLSDKLNFVPYAIGDKTIKYMGYNFPNNTFYVERDNKLYLYDEFPFDLFVQFLRNVGKGENAVQLFDLMIKPKYKGVQII